VNSGENVVLGLIVEGHGEEAAAPVLIRHIAQSAGLYASIKVVVRRHSKSQLLQASELEKAIEALTRQIGRSQPVLVLMDADDDCPKELSANLNIRCRTSHSDVRVSIVIAKREYEAWFLASAKSLAGKNGLVEPLDPPEDPESVRGAKEWLTSNMSAGQAYSPTRHQATYSAALGLAEAREARSFRKFEKELGRLLDWH